MSAGRRQEVGEETSRGAGPATQNEAWAALSAHAAELQRLVDEAGSRYRALCEFLPVPLLLLDTAGIIREVNGAFSVMMGGDRARHLGMALNARVVREDRRAFREHLGRFRQGAFLPFSVE